MKTPFDDLIDRTERLVAERDFDAALASAREAAAIAEQSADRGMRRSIGGKLVCLGDVGRGSRLAAMPVNRLLCRAKEWNGERLAGKRLVIRQVNTSSMGGTLTMARFIAPATRDAAECVVTVEKRLVPLFRRTFPAATVLPLRRLGVAGARRGDYVTSFQGATAAYATDWPSVARAFVPIRADAGLADELRRKYRRAGDPDLPVVGISWASTNAKKELPDLTAWRGFIDAFPANFVSLQYGEITADVSELRRNAPHKLFVDESVDQLVDMDRFAAQVAAVDAVVSISVTGAHLAGAMGKPMVLVLSDQLRSMFPASGSSGGWYPDTRIVRRDKRDWASVMDEVMRQLDETLAVAVRRVA